MEIIFLLISIASFLGLMAVILKKLPDLASLNVQPRHKRIIVLQNIKQILSGRGNSGYFFGTNLLQKILSKIRIIVLKIECNIGKRLENLRSQTNKNKKDFSDNYWHNLKKK